MSEAIYRLSTQQQPGLAEVGGKAQSLIRSTQAGLPVPDGLALSVAFFAAWTTQIKATPEWAALCAEPSKSNCDAVSRLAKALTFTEAMRREFATHLAQLDSDGIFAVRSSSPAEDLADGSFAGMYETYLGTQALQLEQTIAKSYSSMFDFRVVEYKATHGISPENAAIAIVVQQQIASEVSGVGFSLNPFNNCFDQAVINASFGLGEAIVTGQVTPDEFIVEKNDMRILSADIRAKKFGLQLSDDGGIEALAIAEPQKRSLSDAQVLELTQLLKDVEADYAVPVDTEWAIAAGKLYLLQARPITTQIPLFPEMMTQPGERKALYADVIALSQGFDEPLSVLGADVWALVLEVLKQGTTPAGDGGIILNAHGRQYLQVHNVLKVYGKKRGIKLFTAMGNDLAGHEDQIYQEYCAQSMTAIAKGAKRAIFKILVGMLPNAVRLIFKPKPLIAEMEQVSEQLLQNFNQMKNDRPFQKLVDDAFSEFQPIGRLMVVFFKGAIAYYRIKKMVRGTEAEAGIGALLMNIKSNPTSQMGHAMFALAQFDEIQQSDTEQEFMQRLQKRDFSAGFLKQWHQYLWRYGARGFKEIDVATPRAADMPEILYRQLKSLSISDNQLRKVTQRKKEILAQARAIAERQGKLKKFDAGVRAIEQTYGSRELPKYLVVVMNGALHRIACEIGEQFVQQRRLHRVEQIFDLNIAQITQAQQDASLELQALISANLEPRQLMAGVKRFPLFIDSRGKIIRQPLQAKDGELAGLAVSGGVVQGKAKVLTRPYQKPLHPGEILVTVATEPAWTPIFTNAAGVVLEIGGGLQHGAIIAREYGLPCVSSLDGVTQVIEDGDLLEVDGDNGIVKILNKAAKAAAIESEPGDADV